MIYGIADMGSNTVRLSIYKCEGGEIRLLMNRKVMAGLAGYVRHGALTPEGIEVACQTLQGYRSLMDNLELPDLRVFATASLRNISNTEEAVGAVMAATGLQVDVLSGREEAELSFRGAIQNAGLYNGLLVDLGGGSTELVSYRNRTIQSACSLSVGSLSLFSRYVEKLFPNKEERKNIRQAVRSQLEQFSAPQSPTRHICGVGGTVRAVAKLCNDVYHRDPELRTMSAGELRDLYRLLKNDRACICAFIYKMHRGPCYFHPTFQYSFMDFQPIIACSAERWDQSRMDIDDLIWISLYHNLRNHHQTARQDNQVHSIGLDSFQKLLVKLFSCFKIFW